MSSKNETKIVETEVKVEESTQEQQEVKAEKESLFKKLAPKVKEIALKTIKAIGLVLIGALGFKIFSDCRTPKSGRYSYGDDTSTVVDSEPTEVAEE